VQRWWRLPVGKSAIGKAFRYSIERWDEASNYLYNGNLEIDNNMIENAIRPIALGRKNYLVVPYELNLASHL